MQTPRFLYRRDAADFLLTKHGLEISAEHLARLAVAGGGPRFRSPTLAALVSWPLPGSARRIRHLEPRPGQ